MDFTQTAPVFLLVAGVIAFLVSTIQMSMAQRGVAWGAGVLLLGGAAMVARQGTGRSIFSLLGDSSVIGDAISRNGGQVFAHLVALMDVFLILGVILAIVALVAFTPGDALEKTIRPVMYGLIGAVGGGVFALIIVALGLTPLVPERSYVTVLKRENIQSGDTFWINEKSVQLYGADAPEKGQLCMSYSGMFIDCGEIAREKLAELVANRPVTCVAANVTGPSVPSDIAARDLVSCAIQDPAGPVDLARRLVAEGIAVPFAGLEKTYEKEVRQGAQNPVGVARMCMLKPSAWRSTPASVAIFTAKDARKIRDIPASQLTPGCQNRI